MLSLIHTKETKLNVPMDRVSPGISEDTPTVSVSDSTDHTSNKDVMLMYLQEC